MLPAAIQQWILPGDIFAASKRADAALRPRINKDPGLVPYFAERNVLTKDGRFPFGEGYLYDEPSSSAASGSRAGAQVGQASAAEHRGTSVEQQDHCFAATLNLKGREMGLALVADGVSASGAKARPASEMATRVFVDCLERYLTLPKVRRTHRFVEEAMISALAAANFSVVRDVLFDFNGNGEFDAEDAELLKRELGVVVPQGELSLAEVAELAPSIDTVVEAVRYEGLSAQTTLCVALSLGSHLYTLNVGDSVAGLYRPEKGFIHISSRDQMVVELFLRGDQLYQEHPDVMDNIITASVGDSAIVSATLRRFPNILRPGDRIVVHTDGIGPRFHGGGADQEKIASVCREAKDADALAARVVERQFEDHVAGTYQDNIGVACLWVD